MDLKDFVSETITSIVEGVVSAQDNLSEHGALVNPGGLMRSTKNVSENSVWDNRTNNIAQQVKFDVAITAEDSAQGGARIKVLSGILGGDVGGEKANKNIIASRVQFDIPVLLPAHNADDQRARFRKKVKRSRSR